MADFCVAHFESKQSAPHQAISSESILTKFYWAIEAHGRLEWVNIALLIFDTKIYNSLPTGLLRICEQRRWVQIWCWRSRWRLHWCRLCFGQLLWCSWRLCWECGCPTILKPLLRFFLTSCLGLWLSVIRHLHILLGNWEVRERVVPTFIRAFIWCRAIPLRPWAGHRPGAWNCGSCCLLLLPCPSLAARAEPDPLCAMPLWIWTSGGSAWQMVGKYPHEVCSLKSLLVVLILRFNALLLYDRPHVQSYVILILIIRFKWFCTQDKHWFVAPYRKEAICGAVCAHPSVPGAMEAISQTIPMDLVR